MGCGTLCGDTNTIDSLISAQTKIAHEKIFQEIYQNKQLTSSQPYLSFVEKYRANPSQFYVNIKRKPSKDEEVGICLMMKWRIFIIGVNFNNNLEYDSITKDKNCVYQTQNHMYEISHSNNLINHKQFAQIEKDLQRTFGVFGKVGDYQIKFKQLQNVLKRITNYFPVMGYSQGINFIVSYLLVVGYSQAQSFNLFVHLATGKKYILLGMYEIDFPLFKIFNLLFTNIIKRANPSLYNHLINNLNVDPYSWIYKWFNTFFIISFPKEVIKYLWDFVIIVGSIGMIFLAISILQQLQPYIMQLSCPQDFYIFIYELKEIEVFNQHINIQQVITNAYSKELLESDFKNTADVGGFYGEYLKLSLFQKLKDKRRRQSMIIMDQSQIEKSQQLFINWRKQLQKDRNKFRQEYQKSIKFIYEQPKQSTTDSIYNPNQDIQVVVFNIQKPQDKTQKVPVRLSDRNRSAKSETRIYPRKRVEYLFNEINQKVSEQDQQAISEPSVIDKNQKKIKEIQDLDQLDKLQLEVTNKKTKPYQLPNTLTNNYNYTQKNPQNCQNQNQPNLFTLVGNISLKNDNSYDAVSISSNQHSNKEKSTPNRQVLGVKSNRICGCKTKTQQIKCQSVDQRSEMAQSKYQFSDKDSISINHYSQNSQINEANSVSNVNSHRQRVSTHTNFMVNSHLPAITDLNKKTAENPKIESDVEIITLHQPFKKNRRARVNIVSPSSQSPRRQPILVRTIVFEPQEQSLEQINQMDRFSRAQSHYEKGENKCQIESIK